MPQDLIICDVCSALLGSDEAVMWHIQQHLSQIQRLCSKTLPLRGQTTFTSDGNPNENGPSERDIVEGLLPETPILAGNEASAGRSKLLKCPRQDCAKLFKRRQELVRHFAIHYKQDKHCEPCRKTFNPISKFVYHKCINEADHQRACTLRWESVREDVEEELNLFATRGINSHRRRPLLNRSHDKVRQRATGIGSLSGDSHTARASPNQLGIGHSLHQEPLPTINTQGDILVQPVDGERVYKSAQDQGNNSPTYPSACNTLLQNTHTGKQQTQLSEPPGLWDFFGTYSDVMNSTWNAF